MIGPEGGYKPPAPIEDFDDDYEEADPLHTHIDSLRDTDEPLTWRDFNKMMSHEFYDFHGLDLSELIFEEGTEVEGNFQGSKLNGIRMDEVDFGASDFEGADLTFTSLKRSLLHGVHMPRVAIEGTTVELEDRAISLQDDSVWQLYKTDIDLVAVCADSEKWNGQVLNMEGKSQSPNPYHKRGILLFQEGELLGYMKLKTAPAFLAARTVRNSKGETIFWKGMLYSLEANVIHALERASDLYRDESNWRRADVENINIADSSSEAGLKGVGRTNMRFISEPAFFDALTELVDTVDSEKLIDITVAK